MFQAQRLHQNKSGNCVGFCVFFIPEIWAILYMKNKSMCDLTCKNVPIVPVWMAGCTVSKQARNKKTSWSEGVSWVAEQLQKTFSWMTLNGWRAEENFWTAFAHSHSFTSKKKTCEWRHNNNSRGQVGRIMKKKLPAPWNSKQSQVFNHADF